MNAFTGTPRLFRLALRRDRIILPVWLTAITALTAGVSASIESLYRTPGERAEAAAFSAANIAARVIDGPASGSHIGALAMVELYAILAILVGLMNLQAVIRHTRQNEDAGRTELLSSTPLGRHSQLSAALLLAAGANITLMGTIAGALVLGGLEVAGSVASGVAVGAVGMVFAAIAAIAAQVMSTQRGATTISVTALGIAFLLRGVGDAFGEVEDDPTVLHSAWPTWLSPMGWGQQVRPFYQENWEVFLLFAALLTVLVAAAYALTYFRDIGAGMFSTRSGPQYAPATLRGSLGLAWRLHRGALLGWVIGMAIAGAVFGGVGDSVEDIVDTSEQFAELLVGEYATADLVDLYFAFVVGFLGIAATGYTVQALLRMRAEETAGHVEPVLASAVSRGPWLGSHLVIAMAGSLLVLAVLGCGGAVSFWVVNGDAETGAGMFAAAMAQTPAVMVLGAVVVVSFAFIPRWAPAVSWSALALCLVLSQFGDLLELPQSLIDASPFTHIPRVPAEDMDWRPANIMVGIALVLTAGGLVQFRRRNLQMGA